MTKGNGMPLEGEGSYIGGKTFQDAQRKFAKSGKVETKAREAADALSGSEGGALEEARKRSAAGQIKVPNAGSSHRTFLDEALVNPETHFASPALVLSYEGLSDEEKRRVLDAWEEIERRLIESTEEGMTQPKLSEPRVVQPRASRLPEVQAALRELTSESN